MTIGDYPNEYLSSKDAVLAECYSCGAQRVITKDCVADVAVVPRCRGCGGDAWLWIRGGLHQYESPAPEIKWQCRGEVMRWSRG